MPISQFPLLPVRRPWIAFSSLYTLYLAQRLVPTEWGYLLETFLPAEHCPKEREDRIT